tara:strand:- start:9974 stop:10582 length:609 start_codon:yes stop_codon:yes gene_type:complete
MASNEHRNLTGAQLHAPKGFVNAPIGTYPIKQSANTLTWGGVVRLPIGGYIRMSSDRHYFKSAMDNYYWTAYDSTTDASTLADMSPLDLIRSAIFLPHAACYINKMTIWARGTAGETANIRLFKTDAALANDSSSDINVTKIGSDFALAPDDANKSYKLSQTFTSTTGALAIDQIPFITCSGCDGTQQFIYVTGFIEIIITA